MLILENTNYQLASRFFEISEDAGILTVSQYDIKVDTEPAASVEAFDINNYILVASHNYTLADLFNAQAVMGISLDIKQVLSGKVINATAIDTESRDTEEIANLIGLQRQPTILIFFNGSADDHIIICREAVKTEEEFETKAGITAEIVVEKYPAMANVYEFRSAKKELLFNLSPNNSLSYIEAQVDILTKLTALMVGILTDDQKTTLAAAFPGYDTTLSKMQAQSVLNIKSLAKCNSEFDTAKARVRSVQAEYFAKKAELGIE